MNIDLKDLGKSILNLVEENERLEFELRFAHMHIIFNKMKGNLKDGDALHFMELLTNAIKEKYVRIIYGNDGYIMTCADSKNLPISNVIDFLAYYDERLNWKGQRDKYGVPFSKK